MVQKLKKGGGDGGRRKEKRKAQQINITGFYNFMISEYIHLARLTPGT